MLKQLKAIKSEHNRLTKARPKSSVQQTMATSAAEATVAIQIVKATTPFVAATSTIIDNECNEDAVYAACTLNMLS